MVLNKGHTDEAILNNYALLTKFKVRMAGYTVKFGK